ncbi:DNA polymerase V [Cnuella takakiae]|uniref:DNA polymerase V n=1 Tax=Cnuella takakiae TaxID=1302690 RepID=A0A1M5DPK9_9BACT|nr:S24 family peptidase [Cnuella takakiae]OLY93913.1 hypothetical protein BUE76_20035 [Cnuella takakiae]SHF68927.1 DNA polymerase V [Cnuella takakiae]
MQLPNMLMRNIDMPDMQGAWSQTAPPLIRHIDLNEQLVPNQPNTFYLRVNTDCMSGAGISAGDMLIVDRSLTAANGKVIIAQLDGELLVRYYEKHRGKQRLVPATATLAAIEIDAATNFEVWGVVTYVIRKVGG